MTAKQKANAQRFKKAIAEAKKLRSKNPKLTQAQAVKQAWAILYKSGKVAGAKKTATKKSVKKTAKKKAMSKSYHKDTQSHNVRISVMSGTTKGAFNMLQTWQNVYGRLAKDYVTATSVKERKIIAKEMRIVKAIISDTKKLKSI